MLTTDKVPLYYELVDRMEDKHVQLHLKESGHSFEGKYRYWPVKHVVTQTGPSQRPPKNETLAKKRRETDTTVFLSPRCLESWKNSGESHEGQDTKTK